MTVDEFNAIYPEWKVCAGAGPIKWPTVEGCIAESILYIWVAARLGGIGTEGFVAVAARNCHEAWEELCSQVSALVRS